MSKKSGKKRVLFICSKTFENVHAMGDTVMKESGNHYIFVEMLRQVCSVGDNTADFSFFLLGSFDAMCIDTGKSINELKHIFETKQASMPAVFDRQPLYLYSSSPVRDLNDNQSVFSRNGIYSDRPLVLTLFQLNKIKLAKSNIYKTPDQLIKAFHTALEQSKILDKNVRFDVFWNLGESDIVVIFRPIKLNSVAKQLNSLRTENREIANSIEVVATSSHCAFPRVFCSESDDYKEEIRKHLKNWLRKEWNDSESVFFSLGNTPLKEPDGKKMSFLFGEWDYMNEFWDKGTDATQKNEKLGKLVNYLTDTFMELLNKNEKTAPFQISYTIPAIRLENVNTIALQSADDDWGDLLSDAMIGLIKEIEICSGFSTTRKKDLCEAIKSFSNTLIGMEKFLYRLKKGRFEEDLYAYIQPVFNLLADITKDYKNNMIIFANAGRIDDADNLISEYIDDTSRLIENLHHLFSVMAVSPHTYMETYGSNMRSLAAADKLLDAYQGIIEFLKRNFPDQIIKDGDYKDTERAIVIFPYRKALSQHMLLYSHSDPEKRISYISLDFTKMFDIKPSIFMLLHESGHHLGNRLRKKRFIYFTRAAVCFVMELIGGRVYMDYPLEVFVGNAYQEYTEEARKKKVEVLFSGAPISKNEDIKKLRKKYEERIKNILEETIPAFADESMLTDEDIINGYDSDKKEEVGFEKIFHTNYYAEQTKSFLEDYFLPKIFGFSKNGLKTEEEFSENQIYRNMLMYNIEGLIGADLYKLSCELAEDLSKVNGNAREASRLKTVYRDTEKFARGFVTNIEDIYIYRIDRGELKLLHSVFSDIYADLFAIKMLNANWKAYVGVIPRMLGLNKKYISEEISPLMRVYVVVKTHWSTIKEPDAISILADSDKTLDKMTVNTIYAYVHGITDINFFKSVRVRNSAFNKHEALSLLEDTVNEKNDADFCTKLLGLLGSHGGDGVKEIIEDVLKITKHWHMFSGRTYLPYLKQYARECDKEMDRMLESIANDEKNSLNSLRKMFKKNSTSEIEGIYLFYQYLMKPEKEK